MAFYQFVFLLYWCFTGIAILIFCRLFDWLIFLPWIWLRKKVVNFRTGPDFSEVKLTILQHQFQILVENFGMVLCVQSSFFGSRWCPRYQMVAFGNHCCGRWLFRLGFRLPIVPTLSRSGSFGRLMMTSFKMASYIKKRNRFIYIHIANLILIKLTKKQIHM